MSSELKRGAMTPMALAQAHVVDDETVSRTARNKRNIFVVLPGKKGAPGTIGIHEGNYEKPPLRMGG